ncbi:transcriptional regulator FnrL [uncultured Paracoccus sp.]|uniref:transcriptional regulator FnrL n=1 Tax=uncultured Paracoccus sp. TaxID=189685 RepID=UPI0026098474|nr:Crp/Fnr family transcriptional regulator [uncultured Paracoccus sp.]
MQVNLLSPDQDTRLHGSCPDCPVRHQAICSTCNAPELRRLEHARYDRRYEAGQVIVWAGDRLDFVASVVSGVATMSHTLEDGRTQMVGLLQASDFLGRPHRERTPYTVTAVTDVVLCCFRRKPFEEVMAASPALSAQMLDRTLDELDASREWLLLLGRKSAREKFASLLVILARREVGGPQASPGGELQIDLPLTRDMMADYLGLSLETVSRQVSALRRDGIIRLNGNRTVIVQDYAALLTASGETDADGGPLS